MKIPGRKDELQSEAIKLLDPRARAIQAPQKLPKDGAAAEIGPAPSDSVRVDVALSSTIEQQFDPAVLAAERRAKVEDLKQRVQSGAYVMPASEEIAKKLVDEIQFEIMSSPRGATAQEE